MVEGVFGEGPRQEQIQFHAGSVQGQVGQIPSDPKIKFGCGNEWEDTDFAKYDKFLRLEF